MQKDAQIEDLFAQDLEVVREQGRAAPGDSRIVASLWYISRNQIQGYDATLKLADAVDRLASNIQQPKRSRVRESTKNSLIAILGGAAVIVADWARRTWGS